MLLTAQDQTHLRIDAQPVDFVIVGIYFVFVLGIGWLAKQQISSSIDFFLSGRSLPAWVTGLAFISANLGAVEIMGMSANGAQYPAFRTSGSGFGPPPLGSVDGVEGGGFQPVDEVA